MAGSCEMRMDCGSNGLKQMIGVPPIQLDPWFSQETIDLSSFRILEALKSIINLEKVWANWAT